MKYTIIILLAVITSSLSIKENTVIGKWQMDFVTIDNDTIFDHDDFEKTLSYHYSINVPQTKEDSAIVKESAVQKFEQSKSYKLIFDTDSTFSTTKMRSGGRVYPEKEERGVYYTSNDILYLTLPARNNYEMLLNYDKTKDILYSNEVFDVMNIYIQYRRMK